MTGSGLDQGLAPAPGNAVMVCCSAGAGGKAAGDTRGGDTHYTAYTLRTAAQLSGWSLALPQPALELALTESCTASPSSVPS